MSKLYLIATPIGNLEDISLRALRILQEVDVIFCEDTRVSQKLLTHYQIKNKKLISFNKNNEQKRNSEVLKLLDQGQDLALISDAGTPLISDPGSSLIAIIQSQKKHCLIPIPGPSSLTAFLSICPFNTRSFVFEGFLPHGPKQRRRILKSLSSEKRSIIIFESPYRILKSLEDIDVILDRKIFLARELTKKFEKFYLGKANEIKKELEEEFGSEILGEIVLAISESADIESYTNPKD